MLMYSGIRLFRIQREAGTIARAGVLLALVLGGQASDDDDEIGGADCAVAADVLGGRRRSSIGERCWSPR